MEYPHPVHVLSEDLNESRKLLATCLAVANDPERQYNARIDFMAAATRLLRHNAQAATALLREAHACARDDLAERRLRSRGIRPRPIKTDEEQRLEDIADWERFKTTGFDDEDENGDEENSKTTAAETQAEILNTAPIPRIRFA